MNLEVTAKTEMKPTADILKRAGNALEEVMRVMEAEAVRKCPVDTGRLRASIHLKKVSIFEWIMAEGTTYGIHQEYGTIKMRPQPFFRPALALARIRAPGILKRHLRGA